MTNVGYSDPFYNGFTQSKAGFQIEVVDQIRLCRTIPLYLETGIFTAEKGVSTEILGMRSFSSYYYLGVPLTVNYRWSIAPKFTLDPQLGFYYAFLAGASSNGNESVTDFDPINRSDFGLRVAVGVTYNNRWSLRIGYDWGFIPLFNKVRPIY